MLHSFRISAKEHAILDLLRSSTERYGLDLVKESNGVLKRGTVYVTLNRMEEKGLVTSRHEKNPMDPGMPRRLYTISAEGFRLLRAADAAQAAYFDQGVTYGLQ